jgi:CRISPR-associated protein Cmr1
VLQRTKIDLEFVTPAFLSGADQKVAEWREPSIRGQLRWWFRAIAGGAFAGDLTRTRAAEAIVFGSTESASPVRIRVCPPGPKSVAPGKECLFGTPLTEKQIAQRWGAPREDTEKRLHVPGRSNPIHYLGYGPIVRNKEQKKVLFERARIEAGHPASFHVQADDAAWASPEFVILKRALWAWLNLGGIGARSRRGFGSLRAIATDGLIEVASDLKEFDEGLKSLIAEPARPSSPANLPEWSHVSPQTAVYISAERTTWEEAMEHAGSWLIGFRRRYGASFDERKPKQNRDYEWFAPNGSQSHGKPSHGTSAHVPDRAGFGLPLPFGQFDTLSWTDGDVEGRRASPLLLRISRFGSDYHSVWTHMPARLIPDGEHLRCNTPRTTWASTSEQDDIAGEFLSDLVAKQRLKQVGR